MHPLLRNGAVAFAVALSLAGCCSAELADLRAETATERRRALACLAEQAESKPDLRGDLERAAAAFLDPDREGDPSVRATAVRVLLHLHTGVAPVSSSIALEPDASVRREGVALLARLGKAPEVLPALRRLLRDDPDAAVRGACACELQRVSDTSTDTTTALVDSLEDPALDVRQNARRTLCLLLKTDQGDDPLGWRRWLERRTAAAEAAAAAAPPAPAAPPSPREVEGEGAAPRPEDYGEPAEAPPRPEDYSFPEEEAFPTPGEGPGEPGEGSGDGKKGAPGSEGKPAEAKQPEGKPAETKQPAAKPPAAKPPEAKPPEAKPPEAKQPGGTQDDPPR
ncbi:MAG: HEAT repeat domain-containing protein [Planctomycetota bacterium]